MSSSEEEEDEYFDEDSDSVHLSDSEEDENVEEHEEESEQEITVSENDLETYVVTKCPPCEISPRHIQDTEKAQLCAIRAKMIENGSNVLINNPSHHVDEIVEEEWKQGKFPLDLIRRYNKERYEKISIDAKLPNCVEDLDELIKKCM